MRWGDRSFGGVVVSLLGALLALVPLFDVWDDVTNPPKKGLFPTLLENSILLVLAAVLVLGGVWLSRNDWDAVYESVAAKWYVYGTLAVTAAMGWIVAWQLFVQDDIKPYVLAADTVVLGSIAALAVGVHTARRRMQQDALTTERDRLAALFENTSDPIAAVKFDDATPVVANVNTAFAEMFGIDPDAVVGDPIDDVVLSEEATHTAESLNREALAGRNVEREVVRQTPDGDRVFLLRVVPYETAGGARRAFATYTDVTDRRELDRTREQRNKIAALHTYVTQLQGVDTEAEAFEVATEAVRNVTEADAATLASADGDPDLAGDVDAYRPNLVSRAREEGVAVTDARADEGATVVAAPGGHAVVQAVSTDGAFSEGDGRVLELLAEHVSETIERVRTQQDVVRERERLEFMNRVLRHNLLNGLNVVDARLEMLEGDVDDTVADHREVAADRVDDMTDLIETMRTFMQVIVEGEEHRLEPVDLAPVLEDELTTARDAFPNAEFTVDGEIPDVAVRADALLSEVCENLLTNAVRHNDKETPRVTVRVEDRGETVAVEVADNGPGVPDDRKTRIFDKGIKGLQSPGSGFGLYLVKEILDSYGGDVTVEDHDPEGAVFRVVIPSASEAER